MTGLPEFFEQTSNEPYDRHRYKLIGANKNELIFDSWEQVQSYWFQAPKQFLSHIEVLDKKKKSNGGFK
jgi:hypothetical protein